MGKNNMADLSQTEDAKEKDMRNISIKAIRLKNYRVFLDEKIVCNADYNIFVGDNGSGKSSIIHGIDLVLSGNVLKVTSIGLKSLFNSRTVSEWKKSPAIETLPVLTIELFLNMPDEPKWHRFNGEHYLDSNGKSTYGIKMECKPNLDFIKDIEEIVEGKNTIEIFPFEFYTVEFSTFADQTYTGYLKPFRYLFVDNTVINSAKALRFIVENTFQNVVDERDLLSSRLNFRQHTEKFTLPAEAIKRDLKVIGDLDSCLEIEKDGIALAGRGDGYISMCKTESALLKHIEKSSVVAIEEPENHLSHSCLRTLIANIKEKAECRQLFIVTHNSYITSRIGLRNVYFVNKRVCSMSKISSETANFFMKAPNDNILQFVLSKKILLVEGAAEFILMEKFIKAITGEDAATLGIWTIALNNLSFSRYLELGSVLGSKVAVVRDNDKKSQKWYESFCGDKIQVFVDEDVARYTFEVCLYNDNLEKIGKIFSDEPDALKYMLDHKAEAAFRILESKEEVDPPSYISKAIKWLSGMQGK